MEEFHQVGPLVTVTVIAPAAFAIVPEKSPTAMGVVGVYVVTEGVVSKFFVYSNVAADFNAATAPCTAFALAFVCISKYFGTATAAKIPKITNTAMISISVKPS